MLDPVADVVEGEFLGEYQVVSCLGRGILGATYRAISNVHRKEFAIKAFTLGEHLTPDWLSRWEGQTALLERLQSPYIDVILASGKSRDMCFVVKDFVHSDGGTPLNLEGLIRRHNGRLSPFQAYHLVLQSAQALLAAEQYVDPYHRGLHHGNLKPSNVLISDAGSRSGMPFEVKLSGFQPYGLVTEDVVVDSYCLWHERMQSRAGILAEDYQAQVLESIFAASHYRAPELSEGQKASLPGDLYALGVMLYQSLTGRLPQGYLVNPSECYPEIDPAWDNVVRRCLEYRPEARFTSFAELLEALREVPMESGPPQVADAPREKQPAQSQERTSLTPPGMIYIPSGSSWVGSEDAGNDAYPRHMFTTDGFYMDRTPVTVRQFAQFVEDTGYQTTAETGAGAPIWIEGQWKLLEGIFWRHPTGQRLPDDFLNHPVTQVTLQDARAYAKWCGRRLPTEQEWEYAALGGLSQARFPWGDRIGRANANYGADGTSPVMAYSANGYGLFDMAGNVWEWTESQYDPYEGNAASNPHFGQGYQVVRGGCWMYDAAHCQVNYRNATHVDHMYPTVGFRTVKDY